MQLSASCRQSNRNFDTETNCNRNPISRRKKNQNLGRLKEEERRQKSCIFFHNNRARTLGRTNQWSKNFTSTTLSAALKRIEPDDPEYTADEQPSGRHNAHGPETPSRSAPHLRKRPPRVADRGRILAEKGSKFHGHGAIELETRRNCGGSGMGVGERIGSDGPGGGLAEREREREERRKCVLVGSCSCFV